MAIRSGRYRHRFILLKPKLGEDGEPARNSYGELTGETTIVQRPWCAIIKVDSSENSASAIQGQETIGFEIRYSKIFEEPDTDMYIEFQKEMYDIVSAVDPLKFRERILITAIKRR
jgi:head-tail adaptor